VTLELDLPKNGKTICTSQGERDIACLIDTGDWLPPLKKWVTH